MERTHMHRRFSRRAFWTFLVLMLVIGLAPMLLDWDVVWYDWFENAGLRFVPAAVLSLAQLLLYFPVLALLPLDRHGVPPQGAFLALGIPWALTVSTAGAFAIGWLDRFRERQAWRCREEQSRVSAGRQEAEGRQERKEEGE